MDRSVGAWSALYELASSLARRQRSEFPDSVPIPCLLNFEKALAQLDEAVLLMRQRVLSNLEKQGVIQAFESSYELGWNTLKDYLVWQGIEPIVGSRDAIREAFSLGLIEDGEAWMTMLVDRNRTSHTYNEKTAQDILTNIEQSHRAAGRGDPAS